MDLDNIIRGKSEDVLINNTETSAIIEDADSTLNYYADKYIITKYPISTGDIVEYAKIKYIIISQIDRNIECRDEKEYNYKARIRQMDYNIKLVVDGEVEEIPCIVEGKLFDITNNQLISLSDDKIIVTIRNNIEIEKGMRFIKLGQAWKIVGIDKTRKGLIILHCEADTIDENTDDIENEIADANKITVPTEPEEPEEPSNIRIEIDGYDSIMFGTTEPYIITVYENDVEVNKELKFEIIGDETLIWIENTYNNRCEIKATKDRRFGSVILRVSLVEDETIYTEMELSAVAF